MAGKPASVGYLNLGVMCGICFWVMYPDTTSTTERPIGERQWIVYCVNQECPNYKIRYVVQPTAQLLTPEGLCK